MEKLPYRQNLGSLMYAMIGSRPDIAYAIGLLSRFCENPGIAHWQALKRVLRYLKGTLEFGPIYGGGISESLIGFSDADWAGDTDGRKSTSGYMFLLSGGPVSWRSRRQPIVALSTTEAEYVAACDATKEAVWLRQLLQDLGFGSGDFPTILYEDNQSCIAWATNPVDHNRTKHINIRYHYIRDQVRNNVITMVYMPTERMIADILTKAIPRAQFENLRNMMGVGDCKDIEIVGGPSLSGSVENPVTSAMEYSVRSSSYKSMGEKTNPIRL
jgi:hypothetical protein